MTTEKRKQGATDGNGTVSSEANAKTNKKIAVIDLETDPFKHGRVPRPFASAFYDGKQYIDFWGDDCVSVLIEYINSLEDDYIIFAHNGGKFDFFYLLEEGAIENPIKIINGRIVKAKMGRHELRDSYAILPIPLAAYEKEVIDYSLFEADKRNKHRTDILHYLSKDCEYLFDLVIKFIGRFGLQLTIGSTAIKEVAKLHPFPKQRERHDEKYRNYYFGGRVECFQHGIINGSFKVYDVNSMYPKAMRDYKHPIGSDYIVKRNLSRNSILKNGAFSEFPTKPYFIHFRGRNKGAIPVRTKSGLYFNQEYGDFFSCSHEIAIALKHKLIEIEHIYEIRVPVKTINFIDYVDTYIEEKIKAKRDKDKPSEIFAKLLLNSAYGKFGQNPDNYYDYVLRYIDGDLPDSDYELYMDYGGVEIWRKPSPSNNYYDVAVAASITSASRSILLDALQNAKNPLYCDTDSIICEELSGVLIDDYELGAWKFEGAGDSLAIAGKKLYCLKDGKETVKLASKGVKLSANDLFDIARGGEYHYKHDAPNFKLTGAVKFIDRNVRATK